MPGQILTPSLQARNTAYKAATAGLIVPAMLVADPQRDTLHAPCKRSQAVVLLACVMHA